MKKTKVNEIKSQIKENFESMAFEDAMSMNADLFKEYEEINGKRSLAALIGYYRKKADNKNEVVADCTESIKENVNEKIEDDNITFRLGTGHICHDWICSLLDSKHPIKERFCIVREYYHCKSDTEIIRSTRIFVQPNGDGYYRWDDANVALKDRGISSFRIIGHFDWSKDGLPVGEQYCRVSIMRIKNALKRYVIERSGASQVTQIESIDEAI